MKLVFEFNKFHLDLTRKSYAVDCTLLLLDTSLSIIADKLETNTGVSRMPRFSHELASCFICCWKLKRIFVKW